MKKYLDKNVYEAAMERIEYSFKHFENVLVAFSGGKDSGVLLNLAYQYALDNGLLYKLAMYHIDYEAQYEMTTRYVTDTFEAFEGIRKYWICLPIAAQCAVNMTNPGVWFPWKEAEKEIWVRPMPENEYIINMENVPFMFKPGTSDYETQDNFGIWFAEKFGKTAVLIGLRTDESLNRFRAIASQNKVNTYEDQYWLIGVNNQLFKAYPVYDWSVADIWTANAKFNFAYNELYDVMYQAGVPIESMRVASPFNDCAVNSLKLYRVIEPGTWGKLVSRVNGVNFSGIYGGTTAMGWKSITLPKGHTWKSYCYFLLDTLSPEMREHYLKKLNVSIKFWREKGGALSAQTIKELKNGKKDFKNHGSVSKVSSKEVVTFDEYPDDLIEVSNFKEVPSFKRMCVCILKNDYFCKYMGFAQTKEATMRRNAAMEFYRNL